MNSIRRVVVFDPPPPPHAAWAEEFTGPRAEVIASIKQFEPAGIRFCGVQLAAMKILALSEIQDLCAETDNVRVLLHSQCGYGGRQTEVVVSRTQSAPGGEGEG